MFSHDWNRIVQAMDATENKTDGKSQARATWDLDMMMTEMVGLWGWG